MTPRIFPSNRTLIGLALGAVGLFVAVALVADVRAGDAIALIGSLLAIALALGVPLRALQDGRRAGLEGLAVVASATGVLLALGGGSQALGAGLFLALGVVALASWTVLLRGHGGQPIVTCLALAWIGLPYWGDVPLRLLDDATAMGLVLQSPLPILCGTFGQVDLLRGEALYRLLPLGQALPFAYSSALAAIASALIPASAGLAALALGRRLLNGRRPKLGPVPATLAVLAVFLAAPQEAEAQFFPEAASNSSSGFEVGDLLTRVHLGYYVPRQTGFYRVDGSGEDEKGSHLDFDEDLNLTPIFLMPTFEIGLNWNNGGTVNLQYTEAKWTGAAVVDRDMRFEGKTIQRDELLITRFRFRSIALRGELDIPIADWLRAYIVTTQRYFKFETTMRLAKRNSRRIFRAHDTLETIVPTIGLGVDVLIWNVISVYGEVQYLDFTTDLFGTTSQSDERGYESRYHDFRVGVRLELVEHAHVSVEYFGLELRSKLGNSEIYEQDLHGIRVEVSILF